MSYGWKQRALITDVAVSDKDSRVFTNDSDGIHEALDAGYEWLVFTEPETRLDEPIDLNVSTAIGKFLRFEGGGAGSLALGHSTPVATGVTRIVREQGMTLGSLFVADINDWPEKVFHLYMANLVFDGNISAQLDSSPVCEFVNVDISHFENCTWMNGRGSGLVLGGDVGIVPSGEGEDCEDCNQAAASVIINCHFHDNADWGLELLHGIDWTILGGSVLRNSDGGVRWLGPDPKQTRGIGTIQNTHMVDNGSFGRWGIELEDTRLVRLSNLYLEDSGIRLGSGVTDCLIEHCLFAGNSVISNSDSTANPERYNTE